MQLRAECVKFIGDVEIEEELDEGTELCNCEFTLAYGNDFDIVGLCFRPRSKKNGNIVF